MPRPIRHHLLRLGCAVGVCVLLAACGGSSQTTLTGSGHRSQLLSILEADGQLYGSQAPVFAIAKSLGVQVVRFNVLWTMYAPNPKGTRRPAGFDAADPASPDYHFGLLDNIDRAAAASGIRLYLTLMGPAPAWAEGPGAPASLTNQQWKPSASQWAQFVTAVGRRYSGHFTPPGASEPLPRVSFWSLWNEPNYGPYLAPQSRETARHVIIDTAAPQYRRLLNAGWRALTATGHSPHTDTILIGETAPVGVVNPGTDYMTPPIQFVRDLYCVSSTYQPLKGTIATEAGCPSGGGRATFLASNPALFKASGWADHPYDYTVPPVEKQGSGGASQEWADFARLPNLAHALDRSASAWGDDPRFPLYNTEFSYFSDPPATTEAEPLSTVARWINWAEYLSWKNPRIASYDQYLLNDPLPYAQSHSHFDSGLSFYTGQPKPEIYDAFRLPMFMPVTQAKPATALEVWGCARPADSGAPSHHVTIQFAPVGGHFHPLKQVTLSAGHGCYIDTRVHLRTSGIIRLAYQDGTQLITSRNQPITING